MSIPDPDELIADRIKFKFYVAEKHLANLKHLEVRGETIDNNESRVKYEIEMENFLSHLIGSLDALLVRINDKLGLRIPLNDVMFRTVRDKLDTIARQDILEYWSKLRDPLIYPKGSWLTILTEIRNAGMHRSNKSSRRADSRTFWSACSKIVLFLQHRLPFQLQQYLLWVLTLLLNLLLVYSPFDKIVLVVES